MFRIGEFSKFVRVSPRMLRYYDKCGLLRPADTDRFTGYRLYSAAQIPVLSRIVVLRDMGFGVEEIEKILPHFEDPAAMEKVLKQKSHEIHSAIAVERSKLEKITAMNAILEKERAKVIYQVELKELKSEKVLALRDIIPSYDREGDLWERLGRFMAGNNVACTAGGYSIYHDEEYKERDVDVEIAVPVTEFKKGEEGFCYKELTAVPLAATIRFSGPYEGYSAAMEKLAAWVEDNGYTMNGLIRGLAVVSPADVESPEDYITELQVPVKK